MASDVMTVRLHLRRIRVIDVIEDEIESLVVSVTDVRRVSRCPDCGFTTARVHDTRPVRVRDLESHGRPTVLVWQRRRFECGECFERHWEDHPEFILGRRTHVTRRLARRLVADANVMSIREVTRRHDVGWHFVMGLVRSWSERVVAERQRRRCRILLIDETSLRRGRRYVTVLLDGETGQALGIIRNRDSGALDAWLMARGHKWMRRVRVVVTDGSKAYAKSVNQHLGHATHVLDRFHVARWFAAGMIEIRRRVQRIGEPGDSPVFDKEVFQSRYLQLARLDRLTGEQVEHLGRVLSGRPELEAAWHMLQLLYGIHMAEDDTQANQALGVFIELHQANPTPEFEKLCGTLLEWGDQIFAYHDADRASNGRIEGSNNKLGVLKRIAYGFVNADNFAARGSLILTGLQS